MLAHVLKGQVKTIAKVITDGARDRYAARRGDALQSRGDIDAIAKNIVTFDNDVANVHADAELNAAFLRQSAVSIANAALNLGSACDRVDDTGKFHQQAVAGEFDDAPLMLGDFAVDHIRYAHSLALRACRIH